MPYIFNFLTITDIFKTKQKLTIFILFTSKCFKENWQKLTKKM